jgi:FAD/FMN-containing dehydrogenase
VVTAQGEIWNGLRGLRKDNTGYDLRDLFIGSEGTLGIITGAVLKLFPRPVARVAAIVAVESVEAALTVLGQARARFDTAVTAFELFSDDCLELVTDHFFDARRPVETRTPWYALIEFTDLHSEAQARSNLETLLEQLFAEGAVVDGAIAGSLAQSRAFWALRENIAEAQGSLGKTIKHDIALPISRIAEFIAGADAEIRATWPQVRFVTFGHLGDGNLHYNFSPVAESDQDAFYALQADINRVVHDRVAMLGGSISAEHGLGVLRRDEAAKYKTAVELGLLRAIKSALDPAGLMNPGKLLA